MAGLFKIVMTSTISGQPSNPMVNVFGYRSNLAVVDEENQLSIAFRTQQVPEIVKIKSDHDFVARVEVYNVTNGTGYNDYVYPTPVVGLRTGQVLPLFLAYGFQYNRVAAGKRNGAKRFGLCTEDDVQGVSVTPAMQIILDALAVKLGDPLTAGAIDIWFPEILERKPVGVYPWTSHQIVNVTYKRTTTQNSRKT